MNRAELVIPMLEGVIVIATIINTPPRARRPLYLLDVAGHPTCTYAHGYVAHEWDRDGITTEDDNQGDRGRRHGGEDFDTTTVTPPGRDGS